MEGLIESIDKWEIIKYFGGISTIVIGVFTYIGYLLNQRLVQKWKHKSDIELTKIKTEVNNNNLLVSNLTQSYLDKNNKFHNKSFDANAFIWQSVQEIRKTIPSVIYLIHTILLDKEINTEVIAKSNFGKELSNNSFRDFYIKIDDSRYKINLEKPFTTERIHLLYMTITTFIARTTYLMENGYKTKTLTTWKKDQPLKETLSVLLNEDEVKLGYEAKSRGFETILNILEQKLVEEIRKSAKGQKDTIDNFKYLEAISKLSELDKSTKRK